MSREVLLANMAPIDMGVYLSRRDVCVAEEFLQDAEVCAAF